MGKGFVIDPVRSYTYGTSVEATNAYQDGYIFTGYTVQGDETLSNPFVVKETDGQDFYLTAHYTPITYTYSFDAMGGESTVSEGTYIYGKSYLIPSPSKESYNFIGWYTDYGKKLDTTSINIDEDTTLYAHYEPREYSISYDLRGGKFLEASPTSYNIESEDISIPYPHQDGYLFIGWVVEEQVAKYSDINYVVKTGSSGNLTLYAAWRKYTSDYGDSYIKSLDEFDIPDVYPYETSELIPGYVIPYNISSFSAKVFNDELVHSFGVEKINSTFSVMGDKNQYLVNKGETAIYKMAFDEEGIDLVLPESIVDIKEYAFAYAPLKSIASNTVTKVEMGAFMHSTIESFNLPHIERLEEEAFLECHNLVNANDSLLNVKYVGDKAFLDTSLVSVKLGEDVEYLGILSFGGSSLFHKLTSFECLSTKYETMEKVLEGQISSISIKIAQATNTMKEIFGGSEVNLNVLTLVGIENIPDEFLYQINAINELVSTVDFVTIGKRSFSYVEGSVIPTLERVISIGESAFEGCPNLGEVTLEDIEYIAPNAFKNSGLVKINIPLNIDKVEDIGDHVFEGCEELEKLIIASPLQIDKIGYLNRLFSDETFASKMDIEVQGEGTLPEKAFQNLFVGKSVTLKDDVSLSKYAFSNASSIQNVYFSHECNPIIPYGCFENASCLKNIDLTNVKEIGYCAFNNCPSLLSFTYEGLEDNTLGGSIKTVHDQAFGNLMKIEHIEVLGNEINFGTAVFNNDTFEIWIHEDDALSSEALKNFQGVVWNLH